jgi:hypothetical protein
MMVVADDNDMCDWVLDCNGEGRERKVRVGGDCRVVMMAAVAKEGGGGQQWQRRTKTAADNNEMQDWGEDYKGDKQKQAGRDGGDTEWQWQLQRWKMGAVDNNCGRQQQRQQWTTTPATAVDDNSNGGRRQ